MHLDCNLCILDCNSTFTGVADRSLFSGAGRGRGRGVASAPNPMGDVGRGRGRGRGAGLAVTPELKRESEVTKRKVASGPAPGGKARWLGFPPDLKDMMCAHGTSCTCRWAASPAEPDHKRQQQQRRWDRERADEKEDMKAR